MREKCAPPAQLYIYMCVRIFRDMKFQLRHFPFQISPKDDHILQSPSDKNERENKHICQRFNWTIFGPASVVWQKCYRKPRRRRLVVPCVLWPRETARCFTGKSYIALNKYYILAELTRTISLLRCNVLHVTAYMYMRWCVTISNKLIIAFYSSAFSQS